MQTASQQFYFQTSEVLKVIDSIHIISRFLQKLYSDEPAMPSLCLLVCRFPRTVGYELVNGFWNKVGYFLREKLSERIFSASY